MIELILFLILIKLTFTMRLQDIISLLILMKIIKKLRKYESMVKKNAKKIFTFLIRKKIN